MRIVPAGAGQMSNVEMRPQGGVRWVPEVPVWALLSIGGLVVATNLGRRS